MNIFKGTQEEWFVRKLNKTDFNIESNEVCYGDDECVAEYVANDYDALLISKAPKLLEMLLVCLNDYKNIIPQSPARDNRIAQIEELIEASTRLNNL